MLHKVGEIFYRAIRIIIKTSHSKQNIKTVLVLFGLMKALKVLPFIIVIEVPFDFQAFKS